MPNSQPTSSGRVVSASRNIPASAATIFDLLADPRRHSEIDGSETVTSARLTGPDRLAIGAKFGMDMTMNRLPYRITNEVVEFEEGRRVAWRHFGHHIWRYTLEPLDAELTRVTESFDWGSARIPHQFYEWVGYPAKHTVNMARTLERLEEAVSR